MEQQQLKNIIEAVLMSADKPLKVNQIEALFTGDADMPTRDEIHKAIKQLGEDYQGRGFELKEVASGFRLQVSEGYAQWIGRLWEEKPARYTRALLETIALIAYRQPITRGEIEEVRGVSVSSNIIKTLMEREWIKVLGHKDVPGKPALYGTTKEFLDYFNLKSLEDLPSLAEIKDLDQIHQELDLDIDNTAEDNAEETGEQVEDDTRAPGEDDTEDTSASADETSAKTAESEAIASESTESETADNESPDTDTVDDETVDAETAGVESTEDEDEPEAAELTTVPVNADNDDSIDDIDEDRDQNRIAAEADDSESSSATKNDSEAADDDASAEEEFAESEPRAQSVAG
ncbi:MAG: SMC-Scp complex subunit ScpB [Gammaproteobacteria bacterium]|nr:SMC-Scp complex subunit ScpB [Gammaproteobacteria bacterium]